MAAFLSAGVMVWESTRLHLRLQLCAPRLHLKVESAHSSAGINLVDIIFVLIFIAMMVFVILNASVIHIVVVIIIIMLASSSLDLVILLYRYLSEF